MPAEHGAWVMEIDTVGDAYAIAANYLRRAGVIADAPATDDRLLEVILYLYHRGESNTLRLANKAIAKFEAASLV